MDWGRAKTILIISFLVLNIFLGIQVRNDQKIQRIEGQLSPLVIEDIMQKLRDLRITIQGEIPLESSEMGYIYITNYYFSEEELATLTDVIVTMDEESGVITGAFAEPIPLFYETAQDERNELISTHVLYGPSYIYDRYISSQEHMVFTQVINQYPVFNSLLTLDLGPDGWEGYQQNYYLTEEAGPTRKIVSAYTALAVLMEKGILTEGSEVKHIVLGYYSESFGSDQSSLVPVWRVSHTRGNHFINSFTGTILEVK